MNIKSERNAFGKEGKLFILCVFNTGSWLEQRTEFLCSLSYYYNLLDKMKNGSFSVALPVDSKCE